MHADTPIPGHYRVKLAKGSVWSPVRFWHGPPADPETGEMLDRSPRWQAELRGTLYEGDVIALWSYAAANPIGESEYAYLVAIHQHAARHEPHMPEAAPREKINHHRLPPIF